MTVSFVRYSRYFCFSRRSSTGLQHSLLFCFCCPEIPPLYRSRGPSAFCFQQKFSLPLSCTLLFVLPLQLRFLSSVALRDRSFFLLLSFFMCRSLTLYLAEQSSSVTRPRCCHRVWKRQLPVPRQIRRVTYHFEGLWLVIPIQKCRCRQSLTDLANSDASRRRWPRLAPTNAPSDARPSPLSGCILVHGGYPCPDCRCSPCPNRSCSSRYHQTGNC